VGRRWLAVIFVVPLARLSEIEVSEDKANLPDATPSVRTRFNPALGTFLLLIGLNLLNYVDRYILPGAQPLIQHEFHATDQQMGALTTAMFFVYMLAAPLTDGSATGSAASR